MSELNEYLDTAVSAAKLAGDEIKKFWGKDFQIEKKSEIDLVTEVDKKAEKIILDFILSRYPSHSVLAEESGKTLQKSSYLWHVDPLDGTTNFAHGYPSFCTSIGLEISGTLNVGVVFEPLRGELFTALHNQGSFLNGKKISISDTRELGDSLLCTGFAYDVRKNKTNNLREFGNFIVSAQGVRRDGSAALDLCYLACGRFDGFWEYNLNSWDIAAGVLMIQEAGGTVTTMDGSPIDLNGKNLLASNGKIHSQMQEILKMEKSLW